MTQSIFEITSQNWQPKFGEFGQIVEDIEDYNQRIKIVLFSIKGSVAHNPTFGSDIWQYVDFPVGEAIPNIVREATDSLEAWIPELDFAISAKSKLNPVSQLAKGNIVISIDWKFKETNIGTNTEVNF